MAALKPRLATNEMKNMSALRAQISRIAASEASFEPSFTKSTQQRRLLCDKYSAMVFSTRGRLSSSLYTGTIMVKS